MKIYRKIWYTELLTFNFAFVLLLDGMNSIGAVFSKPYPLEERKRAQFKLALLSGLVVFFFLLLLRPFGNAGNFNQVLFNCVIAGLLTFATISFDFLVFFPLFPRFFREERWTIGREIIWTLIIIVSIATTNILIGSFIWNGTISFSNWLRMILATGLIGIAPGTLSIVMNQARLLKKYRKEVSIINQHLPEQSPVVDEPFDKISVTELEHENRPMTETIVDVEKIEKFEMLIIEAENEKDNLHIHHEQFLAATSADNYIKVFYLENHELKTVIVRSTLKKLEEAMIQYPHFFRCHRTAIVNMQSVKTVSGTAQGYRLQIENLSETIPVSRSLNAQVKSKIVAIRP